MAVAMAMRKPMAHGYLRPSHCGQCLANDQRSMAVVMIMAD
jgi:hypothetical protein